jgi:transposase
MFLRCKNRFKNGKPHRYYSVVENRRDGVGQVHQRQVLYLGEINDSQEAAWRKTLAVFDENAGESRQMSLFPQDRPIPPGELNALSLRMDRIQLRRPRRFGDCWLGLHLWRELRLDEFWRPRLASSRAGVPWEKVLAILAINRLCDPGSEWRVHRQWYLSTALDELLETDFAAVGKDRLYRCLDHLLPWKEALCQHLTERWRTLFDEQCDVLLYDLTSTYFEGLCEGIPKAKHGYSRDGRPDCRQVVVALVVTPRGLPLAYEVMPGNTSDKTTLQGFLDKIETLYGKARRIWVMDRGIPTEEVLQRMREEGIHYLVGTPKSLLSRYEAQLLEKPWETVHAGMQVKLLKQDQELYVLAQSQQRQKKENAMRRRKLKKLVAGLNHLKPWRRRDRGKRLNRDELIRQVTRLQKDAGRVASFVKVHLPEVGAAIDRRSLRFSFERQRWNHAMKWDGAYLLRGYLPQSTPADAPAIWQMYIQLTQVEEAFRTIKSDIAVRPIWHFTERRVEAHILVAFLGYCLSASLRMRMSRHAPGLTPREALASLGEIRMVDVSIPTSDGRELIMPRHTEPEAQQLMVLAKLGLELPPQPPPRIRGGEVLME